MMIGPCSLPSGASPNNTKAWPGSPVAPGESRLQNMMNFRDALPDWRWFSIFVGSARAGTKKPARSTQIAEYTKYLDGMHEGHIVLTVSAKSRKTYTHNCVLRERGAVFGALSACAISARN